MKITEQRVAEAIKADFGFLSENPQIISLLALFQEREDFEIDLESETVKPINEEAFLPIINENIAEKTDIADLNIPMELVKERFGDVRNKVLEGLKVRWIKSGDDSLGTRRHSNASFLSSHSKRERESPKMNERVKSQKLNPPSPKL